MDARIFLLSRPGLTLAVWIPGWAVLVDAQREALLRQALGESVVPLSWRALLSAAAAKSSPCCTPSP